MRQVRFQSFASGSSGNCYYLGDDSHGILIDAGISARTIRRCLRDIKVDLDRIWGVFVTHDHADHIRGIGTLGERFNVPVYTTRLVHNGINRSYCVTQKLSTCQKYIEKGETVTVGKFTVTSFPVSHDATDNVGYTVEYDGKVFTFATDLGYVSKDVIEHLEQCDYMILEANYDEQLLLTGKYPYHLKRRIISETGHLSNDQAGKCLADYYHERLKHIFLCHLSKENNMPELAQSTIERYLNAKNIKVGEDVQLTTLERFTPSQLYEF